MSYVTPLGKPEAPIWAVLEKPFDSDKALLCTGGIGYAFQKCFAEAGIAKDDVYFIARRPDTENPLSVSSIENLAAAYRPPLVLLVGEAGSFFLKELEKREGQDTWKTQLNKYVGSLLTSPEFRWEHYAVPILDPLTLMANWTARNVTAYIDLGKVKDELDYWKEKQVLRPLRKRTLLYQELDDDTVLEELDNLRTEPRLSVDIETLYTKKDSDYHSEYPGSILVIGIAPNAERAISFCPFRKTPAATRAVWRELDKLLSGGALIIGQNFFNFDSYYFTMYGWNLDKSRFSDTLIRSHILWPALPKKLQFLTRQYTREPYYKDEGKTYSPKNLNGLRHYNCLDAAVTFEVWEGQEQEFAQRPHLR